MQRFSTKILDCFFLLRIPLLAPVWTIFILGWICGSDSLLPGGRFQVTADHMVWQNLWVVLTGFSLIVASIYVVNQIVDIESDRINRKLFLLPHGFLSLRTAWILAALCVSAGFIIAFQYNMVILGLFTLSLFLGIAYNLPPLSLKNHAFGGIFANAVGHGALTFLAGWFTARYPENISMDLLRSGLIAAIAPALANGAVFLATTIPDAQGDKLTGKQTFCVKYGSRKTSQVSAVICAGACAGSFFMGPHSWVMIFPSFISLFFFIILAFSDKQERAFRAFKWPVFLLSASVALFVPVYGILILVTFFGSKMYYKWRFGIDYPTFKSK
ncbi:MAG: UbiA family prenyltransferase [Chitinispirillaceae bacterium]|nr:UbiA family prenyltransferase [Chitinispirillaceae bacterium]